MRGNELLTPEQRKIFLSIPNEISEHDIIRYYTFNEDDLTFINKHRRGYNRSGIAVQLAVLRYPACSLAQVKNIPERVLNYISNQIDVPVVEYAQYAKRVATRNEHLEELRQEYGYQSLTFQTYKNIARLILQDALENGSSDYLIHSTIENFRKLKIILPAMTTIERIVWEARQRAENKIFNLIVSLLNDKQKEQLKKLLEVNPSYMKTPLT